LTPVVRQQAEHPTCRISRRLNLSWNASRKVSQLNKHCKY